MPNIRNRIKEYKTVRGSELIDNPLNWRKHPAAQKNAMMAILEDVGYADTIKVVETPAGLMIIDGHLRKEISAKTDVPVLVLDLTPEEQEIMLATFDPIAAMAETDELALNSLLESITYDNELINSMKINMPDLAEYTGSKSRDINSSNMVRAVIDIDKIDIFEMAIIKTGLSNRGDAIIAICESYLEKG